MSSNLLKRSNTQLLSQNRIVIDVNQRFTPLENGVKCVGSLSVEGLAASGADMSALRADFQGLDLQGADLQEAPLSQQELLEEASREAGAIVEEARAEAARILEEARDQASRERQKALEEGRDAGFARGMDQARLEQERMEAQLDQRRQQMEEEYEELLERLEPEMVDALCGIYEYVFKVDLKSHRDVLLHLIGSAMRKVESTKSFLIRVSSEDYPYVSMQKKILPSGSVTGTGVVEVIEDMTLHKGQCMIETDGGIFDCGLGTQMEELQKKLMMLSYQRDI